MYGDPWRERPYSGELTWRVATVTAVVDEAPRVRTLELEVPGWRGHVAGQHVEVRLTAEDGYRAERADSLASAPGEPPVITVERLEDCPFACARRA